MKNAIVVGVSGWKFVPLTNELLFAAIVSGKDQIFRDSSSLLESGIVQSVQREDGSGYSWNVTVKDSTHQVFTFHIRTN